MRILSSVAASAILAFSLDASALTFRFDNSASHMAGNQWQYSQGGIQATVSSQGGDLFYNSVEDAIGVGHTVFDGAMAQHESMSVSFNQPVVISKIYFRQWENPGLFITYDQVVFNGGGQTLTLTNSGQGVTLLDSFNLPDITLDGFSLTPNNSLTAVYLWGIDIETAEIPLPAAAWLFGSAVMALGAGGRRRLASRSIH